MHNSYSIFLINNLVRAIGVTYEAGETASVTHYKTLNQEVQIDDYVVIETDTRHGMTVAKVVEVDIELDFTMPLPGINWIIDIVDNDDHNDIIEMEAKAIETIKKAQLRRKREELASALMADHDGDEIKSLEIFTKEPKE